MLNINKKLGFTLAEVLITISIIGVVAMLTIPTALKTYKNKLYSASLKKVYSQITDALNSIIADEQAKNFSFTTAAAANNCTATAEKPVSGPCYFLKNYFKVANECDEPGLPCTAPKDSYITINGASAGDVFGQRCIKTVNGASICMSNPVESNSAIFVDVNGPSEPNVVGVDTFVMIISPAGNLVDWSNDPDDCNTKSRNEGHIADYASGCLTKVMQNSWVIED